MDTKHTIDSTTNSTPHTTDYKSELKRCEELRARAKLLREKCARLRHRLGKESVQEQDQGKLNLQGAKRVQGH